MGIGIGRRQFMSALGGAVGAWPLATRAQQPAMPAIGFLNGQSSETFARMRAAFAQGLSETGYIESQNVAIENRWAQGHADRLPALAAELVQRRVALIAATGGAGDNVALVKTIPASIPVVFTTANDPVKLGLVASMNRPEANITGVNFILRVLGPKTFELLREMVPTATVIGVLVDMKFPGAERFLQELNEAARMLGRQVLPENTSSEQDIDAAFQYFAEQRVGAIFVTPDPFLVSSRAQIVTQAARYRVPTIYALREYPVIGGLLSYGTDVADAYRQAGVYAGRILKGTSPSDLPVIQPTKIELIINLKTAKTLGLTVPQTLLVAADEVIE
jgi:putative ABC transport system substrate-binding protein